MAVLPELPLNRWAPATPEPLDQDAEEPQGARYQAMAGASSTAGIALLGGETRLKILALLNHANELCVCDIAKILEMTPAAISQHLSRLRSGRLVESRRDGMTIYYRVSELAVESGALPVLEMPLPEEDRDYA